jgi:hypothetical protein
MIISRVILHLLAKRGLLVTKSISPTKVIKFLESLHPYQTNFELIRFGPDGDGGYLVPGDLQGIEACFSPGVDTISEFELECLKYGMKIFMADKSVEKPNLEISENKYSFLKKFIGCTNNDEFITMDKWVNSSNISDKSDLLLQMDIEGAEFNSFINISDSLLNRFRIIVVEFHNLDLIWEPRFFNIAETVFNKLLQNHICIHTHPNNRGDIKSRLGIDIPLFIEFTFIRKDRVKTTTKQTRFPHKLDFDNSDKKHVTLPKHWYGSS